MSEEMLNARVLDHFHRPRNVGSLENATHKGVAGNPGDGPYPTLWLELHEGSLRLSNARLERVGRQSRNFTSQLRIEVVQEIQYNRLSFALCFLVSGEC